MKMALFFRRIATACKIQSIKSIEKILLKQLAFKQWLFLQSEGLRCIHKFGFYIYNLPPTSAILFVGQLERHFKALANANQFVNVQDKKLAQALANQHNGNYRPDNLPSYGFDSLKKGILCPKFFSFEHTDTREN